jgi:RHS repeat-associated protein
VKACWIRLGLLFVCAGEPSPVLASHACDALGRRIVSTIGTTTSRYYYDGQSVIEERNGSDARVRYHVNGSQYIDERVCTYDDAKSRFVYYLLKDSYSVAGQGHADGLAIERLDYSAEGDFAGSTVCATDFDYDTDVDLADFLIFQGCFNGPNRPPAAGCTQPTTDVDDDSDVDLADFGVFQGCFNGPNRPPASPSCYQSTPAASGTFAMQGRPVDKLPDGEVLQDNRARVYDVKNGRWLQRDPSGYADGRNLYESFRSNPARFTDPDGRWTGLASGWRNGDEVRYEHFSWMWSRCPSDTFSAGRYYYHEGQKIVVVDDPLENYGYVLPFGAVEAWARGVHDQWQYREWAAKYGTRVDRRTGQVLQRPLGEEIALWAEEQNARNRVDVGFLDPLVFFGGSAFTTLTGESAQGLLVDESHTTGRGEYALAVGTTALQLAPVAVAGGKAAATGLGLTRGSAAALTTAAREGTGALPSGALSRGATLRAEYGMTFDEYMHFRSQGFTPAQAKYLTQPYQGMGHHFIPRRWGLPGVITESPLNVMRPSGISYGRFYERHFLADPHFGGAAFPERIGGAWSGTAAGLEKPVLPMRLWYGSPGALKAASGAAAVGAGGTAYWWLSSNDD